MGDETNSTTREITIGDVVNELKSLSKEVVILKRKVEYLAAVLNINAADTSDGRTEVGMGPIISANKTSYL